MEQNFVGSASGGHQSDPPVEPPEDNEGQMAHEYFWMRLILYNVYDHIIYDESVIYIHIRLIFRYFELYVKAKLTFTLIIVASLSTHSTIFINVAFCE
jgi:hypothetical protein